MALLGRGRRCRAHSVEGDEVNVPAQTRLRDADPRGRVDVTLYKLGEQVFRRSGAGRAFDLGLGDVLEAVIAESVPSTQITPVDIARAVGLLPAVPKNTLNRVPRGRR